MNVQEKQLKYIKPDNLFDKIKNLTAGMAVTRGAFEILIDECTFEDMEWNHMDQLHRLTIHKTYEKAIRIAVGENFSISLTQWGKWPLFITVTDVFVARGLFYQSMTIAGLIFLHSVISIEQVNNKIKMKNEWFIGSHRFLKWSHKFLDKKLYKLNTRLQEEDAQIRHQRFHLRKQGFQFKTDLANYYNSNILAKNTIYPTIEAGAYLLLSDFSFEANVKKVGNIEFIVKKNPEMGYLIWPASCPHEGGPLINGELCNKQIICPWHSLRFNAVELSVSSPQAANYGFEYYLIDDKIFIRKMSEDLEIDSIKDNVNKEFA